MKSRVAGTRENGVEMQKKRRLENKKGRKTGRKVGIEGRKGF